MAKVLLVEDDNNLREIYQARLMAEGYDIIAAQNGEEALVVAKQNKPDLIISDVMMPRISGFEMLDILRNTEELKHTKVIMLTALGQAEDQKRADNLGADKYLVKSQVTLEDIVNAAKELLGSSGAIADVPAAPPVAADPLTTPQSSTTTPAAVPPAVPPEPTTAPAVTSPAPEPVIAATTPPSPVPDVAATTAIPTPPTEPAVPTSPAAVVITPANLPDPVAPAPQPAANSAMPPTPSVPPQSTPIASITPTVSAVSTPVTEPPVAPAAPPATPPQPVEPVQPPSSMPTATPQPAADSAAATSAVSGAATQTLETEGAVMQSQIENYANAPAETPLAVDPEQAKADANNETIATAVEQLNTPQPVEPVQAPSVANSPTAQPAAEPTPTPTAPEPAPASPTEPAVDNPADNRVTVAGKKIIQPITDTSDKPSIHELLAKEEAATPVPAPAASPTVDGSPAPTPTPVPPATPGQSFDPNKAL